MKEIEKRLNNASFAFDQGVHITPNRWSTPISESSISGNPNKIRLQFFPDQMITLF